MRIGVAREIKPREYRVALTPAGALELAQHGHEVVVEDGAGLGSGFSDESYAAVGARVAAVDEVWATAELLLKVKEPIASEYERLREGLVLFTYLHIAADEPLTRALAGAGITGIAYETVETADHKLPLLAPMSEVAGRLAPQMGAWSLEKAHGGRGILLGGVPGVPPAKVVVLGGGVVGLNAAIIALGMQADVWVLDKSVERMRELEIALDGRVTLAMSNRLQIEEASWPSEIPAGGKLTVGYRWKNAGVAPCLPGGHPAITLKDAQGGIAGVFVDEDFEVRDLPVGPPGKAKAIARRELEGFPQEDKPLATFTLPPAHILKPGVYDVFVSVGTATGTPGIALPLPNQDGERRYKLGSLRVVAL